MATILIAHADQKYANVVGDILVRFGHRVTTARTGEEALRAFHADQPALVILDLMVLGLRGIDVLAKLHAERPGLPVIVLSGVVSADLESLARELGVTDVLRRGLKFDVIVQAVNRALQQIGRPIQPSAVTDGGELKGGNTESASILIVDDEPEILEMVGEFLSRRGYRVSTATGGTEALAKIKAECPALILLDIYMPGITGIDLLRRLKAMRSEAAVIMLTASVDEPLLKTATDLGAEEVLSKPVDLGILELAVMTRLALAGKAAA